MPLTPSQGGSMGHLDSESLAGTGRGRGFTAAEQTLHPRAPRSSRPRAGQSRKQGPPGPAAEPWELPSSSTQRLKEVPRPRGAEPRLWGTGAPQHSSEDLPRGTRPWSRSQRASHTLESEPESLHHPPFGRVGPCRGSDAGGALKYCLQTPAQVGLHRK